MEEALLAFLLADAGVAAIFADRIGWSWRVQGAPLPDLTLVRTDGQRDPLLAGGYSGFVDGRAQVNSWASLQSAATLGARAVIQAVARANETTTGGVIQGVFVKSEQDGFEGEKPDRVFYTRLMLHIPHNEV